MKYLLALALLLSASAAQAQQKPEIALRTLEQMVGNLAGQVAQQQATIVELQEQLAKAKAPPPEKKPDAK